MKSPPVTGHPSKNSRMNRKFIRQHGDHSEVPEALRTPVSRFVDGLAQALVEEVLQFAEVQSARTGEQRLLGSSEVLDSLLGKGKLMMGLARNGFTKFILSLAASVSDLSSPPPNRPRLDHRPRCPKLDPRSPRPRPPHPTQCSGAG